MLNKRNLAYFVVALLLLAGALAVILFFVNSPGVAAKSSDTGDVTSQSPQPPKGVAEELANLDLTGKWAADLDGTSFNLEVANNVVTIKMGKGNTSMLYWYGTFQNTAVVNHTVTSTKLDINKPVMSQADSKNFIVKQGSLVFDITAFGVTRTVEATHV